jgi:2-polyprenyl-6-hydroxyphenyl methylase/3-demethylubiquinone-9 3-methyltransferase
VKQYLEAEIEYVVGKIQPSDLVMELGCGYGRVLKKLINKAKEVYGVDTSYESLRLAQEMIRIPSCYFFQMNALELGFQDRQFDVSVCIQNGISAFHVDMRSLIYEVVRVTRSGGLVLFSSYSDQFWEDRLEWFQIQADHGLIGEIDYDATGDGVIVCKDGFKASTVRPEEFISLVSDLGVVPRITEVDGSSIFCEILVQ